MVEAAAPSASGVEVATTGRRGRRRRPSGEPPPIPASFSRRSLIALVVASVVFVAWLFVLALPVVRLAVSNADGQVVVWVAGWRVSWLTSILEPLYDVAYTWATPVFGWFTVGVLLAYKRFRHLLVFLTAIVFSVAATTILAGLIERPRPYEVEIVGRWEWYSQPAWTVGVAGALFVGVVLCLVPLGPARRAAWGAAAGVLVLWAFTEVYLGLSHPSDVIVGGLIGCTIALLLLGFLVPEDSFPVVYRKGKSAHLDVTGPRGLAIRRAIEEQLGLEITEVKPVGLEGSAGSTPLRLTVVEGDGDGSSYLFAKLYAQQHLRADRWYKIGRTLLYGRLEDEHSFNTVNRLVEYEDYLGLKMADAGLRVPRSYGIVEITPGREYVLVTDFLDGFVEIGDAEVDETVIDRALGMVRTMWDSGLAHRDVKPSNVMVAGQDVALIDVAFSQVRPSPWRQAIDLANMMLVLALRSDAPTVYRRATALFTEDEIAEAFAASRGMTLPTQVQQELKEDSRDLLAEFRALAPERQPISIQRWSLRRVGLIVAVAAGAVLAVVFGIGYLETAGMLP